MKVKDVMSELPAVVLPDDPILDAARMMRARTVGMLPVVDSKATMRLVGVITDRDITIRCVASAHIGDCLVRDHMTAAPLHAVNARDELATAATIMRTAGIRRLPVVEAGDRVVGVVSNADLAKRTRLSDVKLIEDVLASIAPPAAMT